MRLREYLREDLVLLDLASRVKTEVFHEMVSHLVRHGYLEEAQEAIDRLLEREKLMSTGIKRGFAIPHAFTDQLASSLMMVGVSKRGVDFEALDDEPVYFVFLLLGPSSERSLHMRILACLSRVLGLDELFGRLEAASRSDQVIDLICQTDAGVGTSD
jgi:fructose-specific phosphotransferase system IIA component